MRVELPAEVVAALVAIEAHLRPGRVSPEKAPAGSLLPSAPSPPPIVHRDVKPVNVISDEPPLSSEELEEAVEERLREKRAAVDAGKAKPIGSDEDYMHSVREGLRKDARQARRVLARKRERLAAEAEAVARAKAKSESLDARKRQEAEHRAKVDAQKREVTGSRSQREALREKAEQLVMGTGLSRRSSIFGPRVESVLDGLVKAGAT